MQRQSQNAGILQALPKVTFKNPKIRIGTGRHEWGAEPGKLYFVIVWEA